MTIKRKNNKKCPWLKHLKSARNRCNCPFTTGYIDYGYIGIRCLISEKEIEKIWYRDKADLLKDATLDRIDPLWHYTYNNCRFIERVENSKRALYMYKFTYARKNLNIDGDWTQLEYLKKLKGYKDFNGIHIRDLRRYNLLMSIN